MQPDNRRTRKKLATYQALASAARELTLEHGLDAVTVEQIADAADVSPRTFFNYFSSKEEAIVGMDPGWLAAIGDEVEDRPADEDPLTALASVLIADADALRDVARRWALRAELVRRYPALLPRQMAGMVELERVLVCAVAARLGVDPERDPYPTVVVAAAVAVLRSTMAWWHDNDRPVSLVDALREAFAALAAGLTAPVAAP